MNIFSFTFAEVLEKIIYPFWCIKPAYEKQINNPFGELNRWRFSFCRRNTTKNKQKPFFYLSLRFLLLYIHNRTH